MSLDVVVTTTPGLFDLINEEDPDAPYEKAVQQFLTTPGIANTEVETSLLDALPADAATAEGAAWLRKLREWLRGESHQVVGTVQERFTTEAYWLPLPNIPGAEAELSVMAQRSVDTSLEIKIAGIGGGSGQDVAVREGFTVRTKTKPQRVDVSMMGTFDKVEVRKQGQLVTAYARLTGIDKNTVERHVVDIGYGNLPGGGPIRFEQGWNLTQSTAMTDQLLGTARSTHWKIEGGLSLPKVQLTANASRECTYKYDVGFKYTLPSGHMYKVTQYENHPAYHWSSGP
jgi:hypothetical protein